MKVLFVSYPASFQNIGGGEIVLLKTREYLEKEGVKVDLFDMWSHKVENYQIVHVFGTVKDCLGLVDVAAARKVPVVITPILWTSFKRALGTYGSAAEKAGLVLRHAVKAVCPAFPSSRRRLMQRAALLAPNAVAEMRHIQRYFGISQAKMRIVHNAVDRNFSQADPELWRRRFGAEPFILSVGRIEARKNQLNLIRAVRKLGRERLVLIGGTVSGHGPYEAACLKEGEGFVSFVGAMDHGDPLLASAYAACHLYVLPGWFETPGLAALEAAAAGARLAVTKEGSTHEYFGNEARYFDPGDVDSITEAIRGALETEKNKTLQERMLNNFSWEKIAQETIMVYREVTGAV